MILVSLAPARAVTPYEAIVGRNVFGLKPPTPVTNVVETPTVPAPKIRLQGLTTILGRRQVLFKALLPAKPGEPAREQASVLGGLGLHAATPQPAEIPAEKMTPEMQTILIEVQREQQKDNPNWLPLPPTELTPLKPKP